MQTDFYSFKGNSAITYLGSIGFGGFPNELPRHLFVGKSIEDWEVEVRKFIANRDDKDGTPAAWGWPWPWKSSTYTDITYIYGDLENTGAELYFCEFGSPYISATRYLEMEDLLAKHDEKNNISQWTDKMFEELEEWSLLEKKRYSAEKILFPDMSQYRKIPPLKSARNGFYA